MGAVLEALLRDFLWFREFLCIIIIPKEIFPLASLKNSVHFHLSFRKHSAHTQHYGKLNKEDTWPLPFRAASCRERQTEQQRGLHCAGCQMQWSYAETMVEAQTREPSILLSGLE